MAFRFETAIGAFLIASWLPAAAGGAEFRLQARHLHWAGACAGTLVLTDTGISFQGAKDHRWNWAFDEIQQLTVEPARIALLSYADRRWKLGADRPFRFDAQADAALRAFLASRVDQRLVMAVAPEPGPERRDGEAWRIQAKHLVRWGGEQGTLEFGASGVAFRTQRPGRSRTWRWSDIENASSGGPYELVLATHERSRVHYGGMRDFTFQLKQRLPEERLEWIQRRIPGLAAVHALSPASGPSADGPRRAR